MSLLKSGIIVSSLTLLSRFFGVVREMIIASAFGTTDVADSFNLAIRFPSLFRRIFGEGALSSVFIPMFNIKKSESGKDASDFASNIFSWLTLILILLTLIFVIFMDQLIYVISPGFYSNPKKINLSIKLCRITVPYLVFICLVGLIGGVLNSEKKFIAFASFPIIISVILSLAALINPDPVFVSYSVILSGILQLGFMLFSLKSTKIKLLLVIPTINDDTKLFLRKILPSVISSSITQINLFISQSISSFVPSVISILSYAERIYQLPLSIIGTTLGTILLPELSSIKNNQDSDEIKNKSIKFCIFLSVPCTFGIFVLSEQIINAIYERGMFTREDTIKTAQTISIFAFGIPAFILSKVYNAIFFAKMNTKVPMKITIYSVVLNAVLNIIFVVLFKHLGIAFGTVLSGCISTYLYHRSSVKLGYLKIDASVLAFSIKSFLSGIIMYFTVYVMREMFFNIDSGYVAKIFILSLLVLTGVLMYIFMMFILGAKKDYQSINK